MAEARLRVIYGDTDQMGVVYYANYFRYFEFARSEYFRARGGSYRQMEREGYALPVVEAACQYKASARYDDMIVIATALELHRASMTFSYEIRRDGEEQLLATGHTVHACIKDGKPARLPETVVTLLKQ
jgi:acyl-CoA thioester hydrolase